MNSARQCSGGASCCRRGGEIAGWIIPSATLVLLPKCPACVAAYVALITGAGISMTAASRLRGELLIGSIAMLAVVALVSGRRLLQRWSAR